MIEKYQITNRTRNIIVIGLVLFFVMFSSLCVYIASSAIGKPYPGFTFFHQNVVTVQILPDSQKYQLRLRDVLVAVNGEPVYSRDDVYRIIDQFEVGTPVTYKFVRGMIDRKEFEKTIPVGILKLEDMLVIVLPLSLVLLINFTTGIIVFYLKPNLGASRYYLLFTFFGVVWYTAAATTISEPFLWYICYSVAPFLSFILVMFGLYFPVEYKSRKSFFVALIILTVLSSIGLDYTYYFCGPITNMYADLIYNIFYALPSFILVIALITRSFIATKDPAVKQQGKTVVFGLILVAILSILFFSGDYLFDISPSPYYLYLSFATFSITVAYAIVKHNAFDIDSMIRRSLGYLIVTGFVVVLFFVLITLLSLGLQYVTGQSSQVAAILSTLFLIGIFNPVRSWVNDFINRRFYREKYEFRETIQQASRHLVNIIDLHELLNKLLDTVLDAIKIDNGLIMLREKDENELKVIVSRDSGNSKTPGIMTVENHVIKHLICRPEAIQINDVKKLDKFNDNRGEILEDMENLNTHLLIPIISNGHLIGILGLGGKKSGAWYSTEDIELLQTLMNQTAISITNAQKVEESKVARFLSPGLAKAMVHGFDDLTAIKRKRLTVFFSDIRGFTALSDQMEPEETIDLLNHYLREMTEIIFEYDGTLDKFMGDGIMVFFGDPVEMEDHPARAVQMSMAMQKRMDELQKEWFDSGSKPLSIGIGINTGYVTVGGIGSDHHMDYTVIGNQVNLAARLQGLAAGGEIIISHATYGSVRNLVDAEDRGEVEVKGLHQPVKIYKINGIKEA